MATSGNIKKTTAFGYVQLEWSLSSQDIINNQSTLSYKLTVHRNPGFSDSSAKDYSITFDGTKVASGSISLVGSGTKIVKSGTTKIKHSSTGTKTFSYSFSQEIALTYNGSYIGTISGSGTGTLTTIPRETTPTLSTTSATMGNTITISMPRKSNSFTHNLAYKIGNKSGVIVTGVGTSYTWTIPLDLANGIPNATSGTVTITCKTYYTGSLVGTKTVTFTANVPSNIVPSCSVSISDSNSNISTKFNAYIQTRSKLKVVITTSGSYSSTIKSCKTTIEGVTYTGASFTSNALSTSGTVEITTVVTDTRGRTKTVTNNINVLAYNVPTISKFICDRADSTGLIIDEGTYLASTINFTITSLNSLNDKSYSLQYKLKNSEEWITIANGSVYSFNDSILSSSAIADTNSSYDVRLVLKDYFTTTYAYFDVSTSFKLFHFNKSGRALAFGKNSEVEEGVEFGVKAFFNNGETPNGTIDIPINTDLDTVLDVGFYCIPYGAIAESVSNKPYTGTSTSFLLVLKTGSSSQKVQVCFKCDKDYGEIYERHYFSSTWGNWLCITKGKGKVLWSGVDYMEGGKTITLNESVSEQATGIQLIFSTYNSGIADDTNFNSFFVPKYLVANHNGAGSLFQMNTVTMGNFSTKKLYISNNSIAGDSNNKASGTANGVTYNNSIFVLRYVIGV